MTNQAPALPSSLLDEPDGEYVPVEVPPDELLDVRFYKAGYEVRTERRWHHPDDPPTVMRSAYSPTGLYIGQPSFAAKMTKQRLIVSWHNASGTGNVANVGYELARKVWHGWSHRAICSFKVGGVIFEEDFEGADDHTPFIAHGDQPIKTLADAFQSARNFAMYVG